MKLSLRDYGYGVDGSVEDRLYALKLASVDYGKDAVVERLKKLGKWNPIMLEDADRLTERPVSPKCDGYEMVSEIMKTVRERLDGDVDLSDVEDAVKKAVVSHQKNSDESLKSKIETLMKLKDKCVRDFNCTNKSPEYIARKEQALAFAEQRKAKFNELLNAGIDVWPSVKEERELAYENWKVGQKHIKELGSNVRQMIDALQRIQIVMGPNGAKWKLGVDGMDNVDIVDTEVCTGDINEVITSIHLLIKKFIEVEHAIIHNHNYEIAYLEMPVK